MSSPAYTPPVITAAGLSISSYQSILNYLISNFQTIYGQTFYLGNDSPVYQLLAIFALIASDSAQGLQLVYNNFSPLFAIGGALDLIAGLNGLVRKSASFSTCQVILSGTPGAVVQSGVVEDVNGNLWNLPSSVTIGPGGTIQVTATCQVAGNINAQANQITTISSGVTAGWNSVTNGSNVASPGQPVETDAQFRSRQAISTELPSISLLAGTTAAIAALPGVTRYNVVENPTGSIDLLGNPPHSITAVVEGGTPADIALVIYLNKSIGCLTNGTTTVNVMDPVTGFIETIGFDIPTAVPIFVTINAHLLPGGTTATIAAIQQAITAYLNSLQIGELVSYSALVAVAMSVTADLSQPVVTLRSLTLGVAPGPAGSIDLTMAFNNVAQGTLVNVVVNSVA